MRGARTGGMADLLGVTPQTVRKYVREGRIPHHNTPGGSLLFTPEDIRQALGEQPTNTTQPTWAYYTRSSSGNRNSINNQIKTLQQQYPTDNPIIIKDNASGLNENRKGLKRLLDLADQHDITDIAITNKDRLTRFGYKYIERYLTKQGINIHVANQKRDQTAEQELLDDFMALIASFSGRFYKMRDKQGQLKLLQTAQEKIQE